MADDNDKPLVHPTDELFSLLYFHREELEVVHLFVDEGDLDHARKYLDRAIETFVPGTDPRYRVVGHHAGVLGGAA